MQQAVRAVFWVTMYLLVAVSPLLFSLINLNPGRGFLINLSVALGFVGLSLMGLQFVLVARFQQLSAPFGIDVMFQFHRQMAYVALVFILAHPLLLFVKSSSYLALLDPFTAPDRARFAVLATLALVALIVLSVWRTRLGLSYERWQLTHNVLAVIAVAAALAHILLVHYYVNEPWEKALWIAMSVAFVALMVWVRIVRPVQRYQRPWRVEAVIPEHGECWSVVLKPLRANGGGGKRFRFEPGQFTWVMVGGSPFAICQHPFSFSSSAEREDEVTVTIKRHGDFTSQIGELEPGTTVYLDGPHGAFSLDRHEGPGFVLVGGGVGITPVMSILRTLADRSDPRPCHLFVGNRDLDSITFREEIESLTAVLDLTVVHVLAQPDERWEGERGVIDAALLDRHLPDRRERLQCFVCGPDAMMDAVERALIEVGVPADRVHTERFGMV